MYEPVLQRMDPHADDIKRLVEDEDYRNFHKQSYSTYQQLREQQKPQIDPALAPVMEELREVRGYVDSQRAAETSRATAATQEAANAQWAKVTEAARETPWLANDNYKAAFEVAHFGDSRGIKDFGDALSAYKQEMATRFGAPAAVAPRSLRADAGDPGVPGPKAAPKITGPQDIRARLAASLRAQARAV